MSLADYALTITHESSVAEGDPSVIAPHVAQLAAAMGLDAAGAHAFLAAARTPRGVRVGISVAHDTGAFYLALDADRDAVAAGVAGLVGLVPVLSMFAPMIGIGGGDE